MKRQHRNYHPHFKYLALFEDPFREYRKMVPSSTYYDWVNNGTGYYFGEEYVHVSAEKIAVFKEFTGSVRLYKMLRAALLVNSFFREIIPSLCAPKRFNELFREKTLECLGFVSRLIPMKKALKLVGKSRHFLEYTPQEVRCRSSVFLKCIKQFPLQLTTQEQYIIKQYLTDPVIGLWQRASIYWKLRRDDLVHCSITTFYRNVKKLGFGRKKKSKKKSSSAAPKAKTVFEIIHMDTSHFPVGQQKFFIYLVVDNFSRAILSYRLETKCNSRLSAVNLIHALRKYPKIALLITDGGPENKGYVTRFLNLTWIKLNRKIAYSDLHTTNGIVEQVIRQLKSYHLSVTGNETLDQVRAILDKAVAAYNNKPLDVHSGITPKEVLKNIKADTEKLKQQLETSRAKRLVENQQFNCENCRSS